MQGGHEPMWIFQRMKQVVLLIFDREIYWLTWVALNNQFKKPHVVDDPVLQSEKKRAKAVNSQ